ncbi:hypothetical protein FACS1894113_2210 [Alphaproteobacteria bacterium]|nr:hypothetical protein FACS1894113_2210 [Alphaproteobacteria bacterium]
MENSKVKVKQIRSTIRRNKKQELFLRSLGLRGVGSVREVVETNAVKGLLTKVRHLVEIEKI